MNIQTLRGSLNSTIWSYIPGIPIALQIQTSAAVAFCSCQKAECFELAELIMKSMIRSMRLALTDPLDSDDLMFFGDKLTEYPPQFATLIEELAVGTVMVHGLVRALVLRGGNFL